MCPTGQSLDRQWQHWPMSCVQQDSHWTDSDSTDLCHVSNRTVIGPTGTALTYVMCPTGQSLDWQWQHWPMSCVQQDSHWTDSDSTDLCHVSNRTVIGPTGTALTYVMCLTGQSLDSDSVDPMVCEHVRYSWGTQKKTTTTKKNHSSGLGAILCKSGADHVHHVVCHVVQRDCSAILLLLLHSPAISLGLTIFRWDFCCVTIFESNH